MAPEQAVGKTKEVGRAVDVYALGAILYELLTGRPPFKGATAWDTLQMVVGTEPVAPCQLQPKVPRDLETICLKCLRKDPLRRYASALDLAEDLRRFQSGEPIHARPVGRIERGWRWCRRNRTVAALAALLSVVIPGGIVALTLLWIQAERERDQAQRARNEALGNLKQSDANFALARESVDRNFTEVSEDLLLKEPGFQRLRKQLLQASREFYQRFIDQRRDDPALRIGLASAYHRLAAITDAIDAKDEAVAHQREAIRLYEELSAEDRNNASLQHDLSLAYFNLGSLCLSMDQIGPAEGALRHSLGLIEQLAASRADSPANSGQLVQSLNGLGRLHAEKTGDTIEAEKLFTRALETVRKLSAEHPESDTGFPTARTLVNLGILFNNTRRPKEAIPLLEQAHKLLVEQTTRSPARQEHVATLAGCLNCLGVSLRRVGRTDDAERTYQQAAEMWKELARKNPLVTSYRLRRASNSYNLGNLYRDTGRLSKAEDAFKQALEEQERVAAESPSLAEVRKDLTLTCTNLANVYKTVGRRDEAERMHRKNIDVSERLCKDYPHTLEFQEVLAKTLGNLADFYREGGQPEKAEANYRREILIYNRLIEKNPRNPEYECDLGLTYNNLGRLFRPLGRTGEAETAYLKALALQEKLVRENPKMADYRVDAATTQNNLGTLYRQAGKIDKAENYYRNSIRGHESLVLDHPEVPYYRQELARSYNGLAALFLAAARFEDAEPLLRRAAETLQKLVGQQPNVLPYWQMRVECLLNLCEIYNRTERNVEAESVCKEILPSVERLARAQPKFVELTFLLGSVQRQMGEALSRPGRDQGEVIDWYGRAIATLNDAARKAPGNISIRKVLVESYTERSKRFLKLARPAAALRDLDRAIELSPEPGLLLTLARRSAQTLASDHALNTAEADKIASDPKASAFLKYNAACVHARSSAVVREDGKLSSGEKEKLAEHYAARAVQWLRKAGSAGYFKGAAVREGLDAESDLAPLKTRGDYKEWLRELENKP
jgi:tetratricopeptide (TPR) repeat protein